MEEKYAQRFKEATAIITAVHLIVSAGAAAGLGVLYLAGVLEQAWVMGLPLLQHGALKMIMAGYFGYRIAPRLIEERRGEPRS